MAAASADGGRRVLATNRKARHEYMILERIEAGVALRGTEVKSLREGNVSLAGAHARVAEGQAELQHLTIPPYEHGNRFNHDPERPRRLLLHARELLRLQARVDQQGLTLVPLSLYLRRGRVKVELGLCRGKQKRDKREDLRRRTAERETARSLAQRHRGARNSL